MLVGMPRLFDQVGALFGQREPRARYVEKRELVSGVVRRH